MVGSTYISPVLSLVLLFIMSFDKQSYKKLVLDRRHCRSSATKFVVGYVKPKVLAEAQASVHKCEAFNAKLGD